MTLTADNISIDKKTMTMIMVGKGPSAKPIKRMDKTSILFGDNIFEVPPRTEIMAINDAWKLVESTDYATMGDWSTIQGLSTAKERYPKQRSSIKRLILPTYPHVYENIDNVKGIISGLYPCHEEYSYKSEEFHEHIEDTPYYLYQLEGSIINNYGITYNNEINSVAGSVFVAVSFAISQGFRHFIFTGFDPDLNLEESNEVFSSTFHLQKIENKDTRLNYYQYAYSKTIEKIVSSGCTYEELK